MFVRTITDRASRRNTLNDLGLTSGSNPIVCLSEFAYKRGTEIHGENEPADYVYQVKKGVVRSYKLLSDGRRQIGAFHLVGDIFGLTNGENHRFTAEAVVDTTLWLMKRRSLEVISQTDGVLARNLLSLTTRSLQHAENHLASSGTKGFLGKGRYVPARDGQAACRRNDAPNVTSGHCRLPWLNARNCVSRTVSIASGGSHQFGC